MQITISVKQLGKKHALIEKKIIEIEEIGIQPTLQQLLAAVVTQQVQAYRSRSAEKNILAFLSEKAIENSAATGKVGFNAIYSENIPDTSKAIETAIQCFEDGVYAVFIGDEQAINTEDIISLQPGTVISFIRLTFLAGSYW